MSPCMAKTECIVGDIVVASYLLPAVCCQLFVDRYLLIAAWRVAIGT